MQQIYPVSKLTYLAYVSIIVRKHHNDQTF